MNCEDESENVLNVPYVNQAINEGITKKFNIINNEVANILDDENETSYSSV